MPYTLFTPLHRRGQGSPMVCLHGFTGSWRSWELILPALERCHDVLAPTLLGHAGAEPLAGAATDAALADAIERAMDDAGFETAHLVGNSLGGYLALQLAVRGRARTVTALAPAGGWARGDDSFRDTLAVFTTTRAQLERALPHIDEILATPEGRRRATAYIAEAYEHIPRDLIAHLMQGVAVCEAMEPLIDFAEQHGWQLEAEKVTCPVRVIWGTEDRLLLWPESAVRYREDWIPQADWIVLDGVGHCPQLDVPTETAQLILDFTRA